MDPTNLDVGYVSMAGNEVEDPAKFEVKPAIADMADPVGPSGPRPMPTYDPMVDDFLVYLEDTGADLSVTVSLDNGELLSGGYMDSGRGWLRLESGWVATDAVVSIAWD